MYTEVVYICVCAYIHPCIALHCITLHYSTLHYIQYNIIILYNFIVYNYACSRCANVLCQSSRPQTKMFNWKPVWVCSTRHWGDGKHKGFRKTCWKPRYAQVLRRLSCLLGAVGFFHETMYNVEHPNISQLYSSLYWCQGPRDERRREVVRSHGRNSGNCKWSNVIKYVAAKTLLVWLRFISRWTTSRLGLRPLKPTWTNLPLSTLCKQAIVHSFQEVEHMLQAQCQLALRDAKVFGFIWQSCY